MINELTPQDTFYDYYRQWVAMYKEGAVRDVTLGKYRLTCMWLQRLIPLLTLAELNRVTYQKLLNDYAQCHERQTTMDFHHQLKGAVLDAVDEGLIDRDPTRKAIIKGRAPRAKKQKYLNQFELHRLLNDLNLGPEVSWDWLILLIAKQGCAFRRQSHLLRLTLISRDRSYRLAKLGIIRAGRDLYPQRTALRCAKYSSTGNL